MATALSRTLFRFCSDRRFRIGRVGGPVSRLESRAPYGQVHAARDGAGIFRDRCIVRGIVVAAGVEADSDGAVLVLRQNSGAAVFVYLGPWHAAALPLRPTDAFRVDRTVSTGHV